MWIPQCAQCFLHFWRYNNIPWKPVCHWDFDILMWLLPSWCDFLPTRCYMGLVWLLPNWCDLNPSLVERLFGWWYVWSVIWFYDLICIFGYIYITGHNNVIQPFHTGFTWHGDYLYPLAVMPTCAILYLLSMFFFFKYMRFTFLNL